VALPSAPSVLLRHGARGAQVVQVQLRLEALGYDLPRYGADGILGDETLDAVQDFQREHCLIQEDADRLGGIAPQTLAAILNPDTPCACAPPEVPMEDRIIRLVQPDEEGRRSKGKRPWHEVRGITLHQTACLFAEDPNRYRGIRAHWGITLAGKAVLIHNPNTLVSHGNSFNNHDVGLEITGFFEGVQGDPKTLWRPKSDPKRQGMRVSLDQVEGALLAIEWTIAEVAKHGGKIEFIHAHRQSSKMRTSDPGSEIWQRVGLVAKARWDLKDGGPTYAAGGFVIPKEWDPSYKKAYRDHK